MDRGEDCQGIVEFGSDGSGHGIFVSDKKEKISIQFGSEGKGHTISQPRKEEQSVQFGSGGNGHSIPQTNSQQPFPTSNPSGVIPDESHNGNKIEMQNLTELSLCESNEGQYESQRDIIELYDLRDNIYDVRQQMFFRAVFKSNSESCIEIFKRIIYCQLYFSFLPKHKGMLNNQLDINDIILELENLINSVIDKLLATKFPNLLGPGYKYHPRTILNITGYFEKNCDSLLYISELTVIPFTFPGEISSSSLQNLPNMIEIVTRYHSSLVSSLNASIEINRDYFWRLDNYIQKHVNTNYQAFRFLLTIIDKPLTLTQSGLDRIFSPCAAEFANKLYSHFRVLQAEVKNGQEIKDDEEKDKTVNNFVNS